MKDYFASAATYYAQYRPFYPDELIAAIVVQFKLTKQDRVIDIGAGTGHLAIQLAPLVKEIVAIEPDPDMLAEGKKLCAKHGVHNVQWIQASDEDLVTMSDLGQFTIATFGASFHWMEHDVLMKTLDSLITPQGGVVVAGSQSVWLPTEKWEEIVVKIIQDFLGQERRAGTGKFQRAANSDESFADIIQRSAFSQLEQKKYAPVLVKTIDEIIGRMFSTSFANPAALGDKKEAFAETVRTELTKLNPAGTFSKTENYYLLMGKRG